MRFFSTIYLMIIYYNLLLPINLYADIHLLVETWLSDDMSNIEYFPNAQTVLCCDRNFIDIDLSRGEDTLLNIKFFMNLLTYFIYWTLFRWRI